MKRWLAAVYENEINLDRNSNAKTIPETLPTVMVCDGDSRWDRPRRTRAVALVGVCAVGRSGGLGLSLRRRVNGTKDRMVIKKTQRFLKKRSVSAYSSAIAEEPRSIRLLCKRFFFFFALVFVVFFFVVVFFPLFETTSQSSPKGPSSTRETQ